jgi:hypothetical protein
MSGTVDNALYTLLAGGIPITVGGVPVTFGNPLPIGDSGQAAGVFISSKTDLVAGSSGSATLASALGKTTYIRGYIVSSAAVAAIVSGLVTFTGLTNSIDFYYDNLATGQSLVNQYFGDIGIPASAVNTAIVLNFPTITGGGATSIYMWGYQL